MQKINKLAAASAVALLIQLMVSTELGSCADSFVWGAATSAYQIEGAWNADGKGPSIWDDFVRKPGAIIDNTTGDVACRSYEKYKQDVQLLKKLGVGGYRFSISWPRVIPTGNISDGVNEKGVQYYVDLVDELIANNIIPMATLYHWDLPSHLQNEFGGWESEQIVPHFVDFSRLMFRRLGEKVKWWITFNEPWVVSILGHGTGAHAPGKKDLLRSVYVVSHNMLKAHAKTYRVYEKDFKASQNGYVGITLNMEFQIPKTDSEADKQAAQRAMEFSFGWYADPVYFGDYPLSMRQLIASKSAASNLTGSRLPAFTDAEKAEINGTSDFLGLNYYTTGLAEYVDQPNDGGFFEDQDSVSSKDPSWPGSGSDWLKVTPFGIRRAINWMSDRYGDPPVVVTENGVSDKTGTLNDPHRIDFYREYIGNVTQARDEDKRNVVGYFAWSLMDNFEWAEGYSEYFGIISVDFNDPERPRTLKDSAKWYRDYIAVATTTTSPQTTTSANAVFASGLVAAVLACLASAWKFISVRL